MNLTFFSVQKASRVKATMLALSPLSLWKDLISQQCLLSCRRKCECEPYHLITFIFDPPFNVVLYGIVSVQFEDVRCSCRKGLGK